MLLYNKNDEIAKLLITDPRIDLNLQNNEGNTALMYAIDNKNNEIAKLLITIQEQI